MKTELFGEVNCRFLQNELGDPTFLFYLFEEITTLHDISKFEEFFIIQFSNIPINSLFLSASSSQSFVQNFTNSRFHTEGFDSETSRQDKVKHSKMGEAFNKNCHTFMGSQYKNHAAV